MLASLDFESKRRLSILGYLIAVSGLIYLIISHHILADHPLLIFIQVLAIFLMVWSRYVFGRRSFHLTADTSEGKLVTDGPYRYLRHPIYASILYFVWAAQIDNPALLASAAAVLITLGLTLRLMLEEHFLLKTYSGYESYSKNTKRLIPFLI
ncbi:MAG: hypothetical protein GTN46_05190 [Gammaproteobacteria bacterium]|nr:hypothetical protein [Gammaproteobacteria bacterium]